MKVPATICGHRVRRVWPAGDRLTLELIDDGSGAARAGSMAPGGHVEIFQTGCDPRLPALEALAAEGRLVSHRWQRRAVVRTASQWVKVVPASKVEPLAARHQAIVAAVAGQRHALGVASLDRVDVERGTLHFGPRPGRGFLSAPDVSDEVTAARVGSALVAWQSVAPPQELPTHTAEAERHVLAEWQERALSFSMFDAGDRARFEAQVASADHRIEQLGERPSRLVHRDLHDGQILVSDDGRVSLLDLDTACVADPMVDLANLLAHLDFAQVLGRLDRGAAHRVEGALVAEFSLDGDDREALVAYRAAARTRLVAVHAFRPPTRHAAMRLLHQGEPVGGLRSSA